MVRKKIRLALFVSLASAFFLSACDQAEQGRVLSYEKGTYLGQKDQGLDDREKENLRQRTLMQQGT